MKVYAPRTGNARQNLTKGDASAELDDVTRLLLWLIPLVALCGCGASPATSAKQIVIIVPGAGGASGLGGLVRGLRDAQPDAHYEIFHWGAPPPLFLLNLQNSAIHDDAERKLASVIAERAKNGADVWVVAHSAGCGVALGALRQLDAPVVSGAVLLAPSVSRGYDLTACMRGVSGRMQVFHSSRDNFWLSWRTGTFGTYDNVKTKAAGNVGFADAPANVVQRPYQAEWESLGNRGGHFDVLSRRFVRGIVAPLLSENARGPGVAASAATAPATRQHDDPLRTR